MQSEVISPKPKSGQEAGHHLYLAAVSPIWMRCQLDSKQPHLPGRPPAPCNPPSSRHHLVNIFRTNLPPCRLFSWPSFYPPPSPPIHPLPWLSGHPPSWPICHTLFRPLHRPLTGHSVLHLADHLVIHPLYYIQMRLPDQEDWMDGKCNYQWGW